MPSKKRDRRKLGARPYKNYCDETLSLAVDMVQNKKMSSYDAEKTFGIPRRTIERKVKNLHMNKPGPPPRLSVEEELNFVKVLIVVADYGAPLTLMDLRVLVNDYLLKNNKAHIFDGKLPGEWWARAFIERHRDKLTIRAVQNIKRARAEKTLTEFQNYFNNLEHVVKDVPPTHLLNYDETNFSDNPGSVKCIFRRGVKYPERIMNSTKSCISVMFAGTADGTVLPPYVVYKSESLWSQWVEGGPIEARYNRTKSGWFDTNVFLNWFSTIIVPWARKLEGKKVMIGDNLSSHINEEVIELCEKYDIQFILLPSNSTQLTQPLDVAFFGPLKKTWRRILTNYKIENPSQASLNKCHFPPLLKKVMDDVNMSKKVNVVSGFNATGIYPFNPQKVLKKVPDYNDCEPEYSVDQVLLDYLKETRIPNEMKRGKNKKLNVESGISISKSDLTKREILENQPKKSEKKSGIKKNKTKEKTAKLRKLQNDIEIDHCAGVNRSFTTIVTYRNIETDLITTEERKLGTDIEINELTGKQNRIAVEVYGNLSDIENSGDNNKENKATSGEQNKKKKYKKNAHTKTEKNKAIRVSNNIDSDSTTTEDIDMSIHSDSDILNMDIEEEDYNNNQFESPKVINLYDDGTRVARNVDDIEKNIFEEIEKIDQGYIEPEICDMNITKNAISDKAHIIMNKKDQNSMIKKNILDKSMLENEKGNRNECMWNIEDTILARYYSSHQWKYYIGIIENVNKYEKVYSVSYLKKIQLGDNIKFVKPKRLDKDFALPENSIVKSMNLLQISENPAEFTLYDDEDIVYFM